MPTFTFEGIDAQGREVKSEVEAGNEQEALGRIRGMGVRPVKVAAKSGRGAVVTPMAGKKSAGILAGIGGVPSKSITQFTRQFATLIDAGLPIVRSLDILSNQQKTGPFKSAIDAIGDDVKGGSTLSESMAKHPKIFDKLYVSMVKAGEAGGVLDTILTRLAEFREKVEALRRKIVGAMVYPAAVMTIAVIILAFIMLFIIPGFEKMFKEMDLGELPSLTQLLITIASTIKAFWFLLPGIPLAIFIAFKITAANPQGRYMIDTAKLNIPVFGQLIRKSVISRFCRTLGTLLESGVTILDALNILRGAVGNAVIANAVGEVHASIREGDNIATPLKRCKAFDDIVVNMIDVGEETGELPKMLSKIADNYDSEVDATVAGLTALLEPIMIIGLGGIVGFIVVALFMPMIDMMQKLGAEKGGGGD
ncbi:MAG TPA: type II secretion system F family protein [Planctomycetota bacterium]|nr:type II secretion system F family protein [Planctomycetota bacterium]